MRGPWKMVASCFLVFAVASLGACCAAFAQDAGVTQEMQLGAQAMQSGNFPEAERQFQSAIKMDPQFASGYLDLGLAQVRQGKTEQAVKTLQAAVRLDPKLSGAHMFLGIAEYQLHQLDAACADLKQEVALQPNRPEALLWLGIVELAAGRPEAAVPPLDKAARLSPRDLNILDYRGRAHSLVVRDNYEQMYKIDPNSWQVHRALGETYAEDNQPKQAIGELKAAIAIAPNNADLYEELGDQYQKVAQFDLATAAYEKELKLNPQNPIAMFNLGSIRVEHGDSQDGVPMLEQVEKTYGHSAPVFFYLGLGMEELGKNAEAAKYLQEVVQANDTPDLVERSYYELSRVYRKLQRPADAQHALQEFTKLKAQTEKQRSAHILKP